MKLKELIEKQECTNIVLLDDIGQELMVAQYNIPIFLKYLDCDVIHFKYSQIKRNIYKLAVVIDEKEVL